MNFLRKISPALVLRFSLGVSYIYSGYDLFMHPTGWYWAIRPLPQFLQTIINDKIGTDLYLKTQGIGELALALVFLVWFLPKKLVRFAALLVAFQMASILIFLGIRGDTFRDIVILGAALALFVMYLKK